LYQKNAARKRKRDGRGTNAHRIDQEKPAFKHMFLRQKLDKIANNTRKSGAPATL
jgi:hypothetical protein